MPTQELVDSHYGLILLDRDDDGHVVVSGESIPTASINRSIDGDASRNNLALDEVRYELLVFKGSWRRAHRNEISGPTGRWIFAPSTQRSHCLVRGHRSAEPTEVGKLVAEQTRVTALWGSGSDSKPSPGECAMGYLLAATYGTGKPLTLMAVVQGTVNVLVPG